MQHNKYLNIYLLLLIIIILMCNAPVASFTDPETRDSYSSLCVDVLRTQKNLLWLLASLIEQRLHDDRLIYTDRASVEQPVLTVDWLWCDNVTMRDLRQVWEHCLYTHRLSASLCVDAYRLKKHSWVRDVLTVAAAAAGRQRTVMERPRWCAGQWIESAQ